MPAHRRTSATPRETAARPRAQVAVASFVAALSVVSGARADEVSDGAEPEPSRLAPLDLELSLGGFGTNHGPGMAAFGIGVFGHLRTLEGGVLAEAASPFFGGSMGGIALLAGVGVDALPRLRFALLGEFGRHGYSGNNKSDLLSAPSPGGALPYAGVRAGAVVALGDMGFSLGLWFFVRDDIGQRDVTYSYHVDGFFGPSYDTTGVGHLGALQTGVTLRLGFAL